jgi:hypothetical protein
MSDYLSRLVARAMGASAGLRPRTASLFEPVKPSGHLPSTGEPRSPSRQEGPEAAIAPPATSARRGHGRRLQETPVPADSTAPRLRRGPVDVDPPRPALEAVPESPRRTHVAPHREPTEPARAEPTATRSAAAATALREDGRPGPAPVAFTPASPRPSDPPNAAPPFIDGSRQASVPSTPMPAVSVTPAAALPAATAQRARATRIQSLATRAVAAREPHVHVTIGRIEVRAPAQPAPSRREASPSPVMPLDQYLRERRR